MRSCSAADRLMGWRLHQESLRDCCAPVQDRESGAMSQLPPPQCFSTSKDVTITSIRTGNSDSRLSRSLARVGFHSAPVAQEPLCIAVPISERISWRDRVRARLFSALARRDLPSLPL